MIEKLKQISAEMNKQDHRSTFMPLFMVQEKVKVYGAEDWCSEKERRSEPDTDYLCDKCAELEELPNACDDCDDNSFCYFNWEWQIQTDQGVFITAKACDEYIKRRSYEFGEVRSYAISAYWSDEMQRVLQYLSALSNDDGLPHLDYLHSK